MTYNQLHNYQYNLSRVLNAEFKEQLLSINPKAHLCYQEHHQAFTVSLYESVEFESKHKVSASVSISTEHLTIISEYIITPAIEQLCQDLTKFIMNKGPEHDNTINTTS